MGERPS
ncbi:Protein of unknown function, partial [Gryllus bimaculatus]